MNSDYDFTSEDDLVISPDPGPYEKWKPWKIAHIGDIFSHDANRVLVYLGTPRDGLVRRYGDEEERAFFFSDDVTEWLELNQISHHISLHNSFTHGKVAMMAVCEQDAVAFKLTWS